jgi:Protein of unknown function (DUF1180).
VHVATNICSSGSNSGCCVDTVKGLIWLLSLHLAKCVYEVFVREVLVYIYGKLLRQFTVVARYSVKIGRPKCRKIKMCVQSVCYITVIGFLPKCEWILILCLMLQCLIISENKVHGVGSTITTLQHSQHPETPVNHTSPNAPLSNAGAPKNHNTGNVTTTIKMPQRFNITSSSTIQESVQPARKIISTGAFIRAFYVFVGLGAIIVMYIIVRTVR